MAIVRSYTVDRDITDNDLFLGTLASNLSTVNYTAKAVADYLNQKGKISISGQMNFRFEEPGAASGIISIPGSEGNNTPFADITEFLVPKFDLSMQDVTPFLEYIVGSEILLSQQGQLGIFGNYKILTYEVTVNPSVYLLTVEFVGGEGNITNNTYYDLAFFRESTAASGISLTTVGTSGPATLVSGLLNIPVYTPDLSGYVPITRTISTTSPLQGGGDLSENRTLSILQSNSTQDGYLSAADWQAFNSKFVLPALTSGSVLFSNGTTIAQDNANFFWDDTNNRLGIGTSVPTARLHIEGVNTINSIYTKNHAGFQAFVVNNQGNTSIGLSAVSSAMLNVKGANNTSASFALGVVNSSSVDMFNVRNDGNVGVGMATPAARLDVRAQGALSTDIAFRVRNSADTANLLEVNGIGQVGIGTGVDAGTLPSRLKINPLNSKVANIGNFNGATLPATINDGDLYVYGGNLWLNSEYSNTSLKGNLYRRMKLTGLQPDFFYSSGVSKNFNQFNSSNYNTFGYGSLVHTGYSYGNTVLTNSPTSIGIDSRMYDGFLMSLNGPNSYDPNPQLFVDIKGNIFARGYGTYAESDWKKALTDNANKTTTVGSETSYTSVKFAIDSTTQGFLPPRMTNAQRLAIASPAVGLMVYCTDAIEGLYINKSTGWTFII